MGSKSNTQSYLTAVGMTGSDAQISRLLTALGTSSHNDVETFANAAITRFVRHDQLTDLTQADEQNLWVYRQLWAKVRGGADNDPALITEGWKQTREALAEVRS